MEPVSMLAQSGFQAYQRNKFETASPHRLILMLYDGALSNLARAKQAQAENRKLESGRYIRKCQDILFELIACLNEEQGGEIAKNLKQLYMYMIEQLLRANIRNSPEPIDEAETLLRQLRDAWEQIGKEVGLGATR